MYNCGCDECSTKAGQLNLAIGDKFKGLLNTGEKAFKRLHEKGSYNPKDLQTEKAYKDLANQTFDAFNFAITDNDMPETMRTALQDDARLFGGLKTHAQLFEASKLLLDDKGNLKPFSQLSHEYDKLNVTYNKNYLEAEYEFAVGSSQMAAKWEGFSDSDRYELQYRTAGDNRVRQEHAALNGTTLPKSDPFWGSYTPPNGWNCRCTTVEVLKDKFPTSDSDKAIAAGEKATTQIGKDGKNRLEIFRFNPGADKVVFPPAHPYTKVAGAKEVKENINDQLIKTKQIEEKLNIKKGKEMNFEEANELKGNINYSKGGGYLINCQSCVVSNELRRRGYDVTALENTKKEGNIPNQLSRKTNWAWLNEKGEMPKKLKAGGIEGFDKKFQPKSKSIGQLSKELIELTKETGRYHIDFGWKRGNSGHIITLERLEQGTLRLYDPQNGKIVRWAELSKEIKLSYGVNVLRVDNLQLNTDIIEGIVKKLD